jgi:tetraacyldisaccharide 4'-kinase
MMRAPAFWQDREGSLAASLLAPVGRIYGAAVRSRMKEPGHRAAIPVLCIGNLTMGGAGKTPTAIHAAERLKAAGRRPVFLTRGYGGRLKGPVLVDPARHGPEDCGDEPLLLARIAPVVLSAERPAGAELAADFGDVIVMDDGLQNPSLVKTFALAVIDGGTGIGNGLCFPAGPLRAPLDAQLERVDAVLAIGRGIGSIEATGWGKPLFRADLVPDTTAAAGFQRRDVFAFAGIGRPEKFFESLREIGARTKLTKSFADHHPYSRREIETLLAHAESAGLVPVTTEKDMVKIRRAAPELVGRIAVLPISLVPRDPAFDRLLLKSVNPSSSA